MSRGRGPTAPEEVAPLHCAWHLCQPFRALQKLAQEIVGKLLLGIQETPGGFWELPPKCSRGCFLSCSLSGLSLFFMFISGRNRGSSIHELSLSASLQPLADPFVSLGEKDTCSPIPSAPPRGSRKLALVIVNYLWKRQSPGLPSWQKLPDQQW